MLTISYFQAISKAFSQYSINIYKASDLMLFYQSLLSIKTDIATVKSKISTTRAIKRL